MRKWTYSKNDGQHIINDDRGILVAMVCDAQTAKSIISLHEQLNTANEIIERYKKEYFDQCKDNGVLRQQLEAKKSLLRLTDQSRDEARRMYTEACDQASEFQQQLTEKEATIKELREYLDIKQKQVYSFAAGVEEKEAELKQLRDKLNKIEVAYAGSLDDMDEALYEVFGR